ncbi:DUF3515 family protein [Okibacterium fritillariae]|uniref:DUF3515 family protein n=1 Tax=Okibacterium fritillariae TaxID=123320 RepID=UPI004055490F
MSSRKRLLPLVSALGAVALALVVTGCAPTVTATSAPDANDPACADVTVRLPDTVAGKPQRDTDAQATGAWGTPAAVLLHCGVAVPGPTTDTCVSLNGIDWIADDSDKPNYRYTTYGRTPAVEVFVNSDADTGGVSGTTALIDLGPAVSTIPATKACTGPEDVLGGVGSDNGDPTATPVNPAEPSTKPSAEPTTEPSNPTPTP